MNWTEEQKKNFDKCFVGGRWDTEANYLRYIFKDGNSWQIIDSPQKTLEDIESYIREYYLNSDSIGYKKQPSKKESEFKEYKERNILLKNFTISCETKEEFEDYYNGPKYRIVLDELKNWIRSELKYNPKLKPLEAKTLEKVREKIFELQKELEV